MGRKSTRNTYIIFALICLIVFNTGTIFIRLMGNRADKDKAIPVFKEENKVKLNIGNEKLYTAVFGRASSIMNLHRSSEPFKFDWRNIFPSILAFNEEGEPREELVEDMEDTSILDDFIIIDRIEEYEDLIVIDEEGAASPQDLPQPLNIQPLKIDESKPYILLYHTHGTESYSSLENNIHHTTDRKYNVTTIGEIMAKVLEGKGHKVEHVIKYHDIPSYSKSYAESLKTARQKLEENQNLKILLDVHRDGFDQNDPKVKKNLKNILKKSKVKIGDKEVATFFFVIGPDAANKEQVLNFAKYFKVVSDLLYPGLCTGIVIKPVGKYNQFLSDYSTLIEVGNNLNTMEEAKETAKIVGEILDLVIGNIRQ